MNIRQFLFALLLLLISPFAIADEMGTGSSASSSSSSSSEQMVTEPDATGGETGSESSGWEHAWQMLADWLE